MKTFFLRFILGLGVLVSVNCEAQKPKSHSSNFKISKETTHKIAENQNYTFGYLQVPENRSTSNSKTIEIPVYIFKSRNPNPQPDPIIYTVGGPGYSTMPSAQYMKYYRYLDDRDFILVEQRGNYYAKPHLGCPEWAEAVAKSNHPNFDEQQSDQLFNDAAKRCRNRLTNKNIDLNGYNTNEIAADINDLANALGIEHYNLLTISYSTKIAQVLLRDYPNRIRSVVMDSPLPLEVSYDEESVLNLLETVKKVLDDCAHDPDCNAVFPNLKTRFFSFLREKTQNPLTVDIENPEDGSIETFKLKGSDLMNIFSLASTSEVSNIPLEINKILEGDLSSVSYYLQSLLKQSPGDGSGRGMRLSVWCAEEYPFTSQEVVARETNRYPEVAGLSPAITEASVCDIWGVKKVSAIENKAIKTDIPVLLINGEYDELTPIKWAQNMLPNLENSYHIIFKGWKHTPTTYWDNPCGMEVANAFFNNPNAKPNPQCFETIETPKFKTK
ncbi:alpha/beta fold hydrolase [Winogradskyella sp.]|uniref:alpha/beta fold hydrolase n=1 Tax=Winogradskyella sp. TaxID=1883156 RepID=UPI00261C9B2A|nr:alpha/beta fold hydrolase [Winogradskyella sp.]